MNVVFISPHFPPQFFRFCVALRDRGVNMLGVGDTPREALAPELRDALTEYYFAPNLEYYPEAHKALSYLSWRHGKIDRIESLNEHWLALEAKLREDFNVFGPRPEETRLKRSKMGMADFFRSAGVPCPEGALYSSPEQARAFAREHGFPLVLKPDTGVGASRTFKVSTDAELEKALLTPLEGFIIQPFVRGEITSFDGLTDHDGRIVYYTSHVYSGGVMEVVNEGLDIAYWSRREIPAELERLGRKSVEAFGMRERFFHIEFFERGDGRYVALEINLRPPGGFTTDLMNFGSDVDVYRMWAAVLTGDRLPGFTYERKFHVAHVARRWTRTYRLPQEEVIARLGPALLNYSPMPPAFAGAMGDEMYLIRYADYAALREAIGWIQAPA
ncbi:MAG: ATP-grasp domain-containing protein [Myxococcaceae bacterium]